MSKKNVPAFSSHTNLRAADRKAAKCAEAEARQAARNGRTIDEQISLLKSRAGNSAKEIARLEKRRNAPDTATNSLPGLEGGIKVGEMVVIVGKPRQKAKERKSAEKKHRPGHQN